MQTVPTPASTPASRVCDRSRAGMALGLMLSAFGALAVEWWRNSGDDEQENKKDVSDRSV